MPEEGIEFPAASAAIRPLIVIGTLALKLPAEIVKVAVATVPLGITFVVRSNIRHVVDPAVLEQDALFGPPTTVAAVTSAG